MHIPILHLLLQASDTDGGITNKLLLIGAIILVFYFFMIRPQQRRQKTQKKFFETIKTGDQVITIGGIHGKINATHDHQVTLEVDNKGTKIIFEKSAISLEASKKYNKKIEVKA